jgi:myb proto-oncogene protein
VAALVPGRSQKQCYNRWDAVVDPSIGPASGRKGGWTVVEDIKLKDAVKMRGGKNWEEIAALVSDRTRVQCWNR